MAINDKINSCEIIILVNACLAELKDCCFDRFSFITLIIFLIPFIFNYLALFSFFPFFFLIFRLPMLSFPLSNLQSFPLFSFRFFRSVSVSPPCLSCSNFLFVIYSLSLTKIQTRQKLILLYASII